MPSGPSTTCPSCGRTFTEGELFCPFDRTALPGPAAPSADPLIGAVINGSYTVLEKLGAGGMGVVYKALQHRLNRQVALKVLSARFGSDPAAADRFRLEALAASQLTNGHTVVVHDFGTMDDGALYIAMQMLEGESLRARLKNGPLQPRIAAMIALHVCESLAEAHERPTPIIHRDIKPDNVFVRDTSQGQVHATVLDFGLARFADSQRMRLTSANQVIGTPAYMSPEQARGGQNMDARSDLYSVGVLLFEMLAGRPPFEASDPPSLLFKHVFEAPPRLAEVAPGLIPVPALEDLVRRLLEKSADDRPRSAAVVRAQLSEIYEALPRLVPVATYVSSAPTLTTRRISGEAAVTAAAPRPTLGVGTVSGGPLTPGPGHPAFSGDTSVVSTRTSSRTLRVGAVVAAVGFLVILALGWMQIRRGNGRPDEQGAPAATLPAAPDTAPRAAAADVPPRVDTAPVAVVPPPPTPPQAAPAEPVVPTSGGGAGEKPAAKEASTAAPTKKKGSDKKNPHSFSRKDFEL